MTTVLSCRVIDISQLEHLTLVEFHNEKEQDIQSQDMTMCMLTRLKFANGAMHSR